MTTLSFDTYDILQRLKAAGIPHAQAEAIVESLRTIGVDHMASKQDIAAMESRLGEKIEHIRADIFKWLVPLLLGQAGLIAVLMNLT